MLVTLIQLLFTYLTLKSRTETI